MDWVLQSQWLTWQFLHEDGSWCNMHLEWNPVLNQLLRDGGGEKTLTHRCRRRNNWTNIAYTVNVTSMQQRAHDTGTVRPIRAVMQVLPWPNVPATAAAAASHAQPLLALPPPLPAPPADEPQPSPAPAAQESLPPPAQHIPAEAAGTTSSQDRCIQGPSLMPPASPEPAASSQEMSVPLSGSASFVSAEENTAAQGHVDSDSGNNSCTLM